MAVTNAQKTNKRPAPAKRTSNSSARGRSGSANGASRATRQAAVKVKGPAIAGGAALAGLAGGLALAGTRVRSRKVLGVPVPRRSRLTKTGKSLGQVAGQVGSASRQLAVLTEEVRRAREQADKADRRSPIEVLLSGLTNRKLRG